MVENNGAKLDDFARIRISSSLITFFHSVFRLLSNVIMLKPALRSVTVAGSGTLTNASPPPLANP